MTISPYVVPGFWTELGALAKIRQLVRRGFPDNLRNWRFITLTLDRERFPDPEAAYEAGKRSMRHFIDRLREDYSIKRWCWKLEFHEPDENGKVWPHWHLLVDYKRPIEAEDIHNRWAKGRTEIKGVTDARFDYLFKYVSKAAENLPDWVLNRSQMRLFQTSMGFFPSSTGDELKKEEKASPRQAGDDLSSDTQNERIGKSDTIGERIQKWSKLVVGRTTLDDGSKRHQLFVIRQDSWGALLVEFSQLLLRHGLGADVLKIDRNKIETKVQTWLSNYLPDFQPASS
ncbi:MAG: hypothetical protein QM715_15550 [Nibricoccus sp.]